MLRGGIDRKKAGASFVKKEYHFTESLDGDHTFGNGRAYLVGTLCVFTPVGSGRSQEFRPAYYIPLILPAYMIFYTNRVESKI